MFFVLPDLAKESGVNCAQFLQKDVCLVCYQKLVRV